MTPWQITWTGFGLAVAAAAAVASGHAVPGLIVWLLSRLADGLDGVVARVGAAEPFGGYLDITLDMAAYSLMVLAFAVAHPGHALMWQAILVGYVLAITTSLALLVAAERTRPAPSAAGDRTFQFTRGLAEAGETIVYACWA